MTQDQLCPVLPITKVQRVPGEMQWKKFTPEAIQRAAFSKGSLRQIAASVGGKHRSQRRSASFIGDCKAFVSFTVIEGQQRRLKRLREVSKSKPFDFWITNHVFDETKLWCMVKGFGYRCFSTLASHTQVTWKDADGIQDEDVIRCPRTLRNYTAATQWGVLTVANGLRPGITACSR